MSLRRLFTWKWLTFAKMVKKTYSPYSILDLEFELAEIIISAS